MTYIRHLNGKAIAAIVAAFAALIIASAAAIASDGENMADSTIKVALVEATAQETTDVQARKNLQTQSKSNATATANAKCRTLGDGNLQTRQAAGVFCDVCKIQGCDCNGSECTNCGNKIAAKPAQTASTFCNICAIQGCSCSGGKCVDCKAGSLTAEPPRK